MDDDRITAQQIFQPVTSITTLNVPEAVIALAGPLACSVQIQRSPLFLYYKRNVLQQRERAVVSNTYSGLDHDLHRFVVNPCFLFSYDWKQSVGVSQMLKECFI
jgi:hypothetical protein